MAGRAGGDAWQARMRAAWCAVAGLLLVAGCGRVVQQPVRDRAEATNTFFTAFQERSPKYLDPTASYAVTRRPTPGPYTSRCCAFTT